jgi:hypothetical protein
VQRDRRSPNLTTNNSSLDGDRKLNPHTPLSGKHEEQLPYAELLTAQWQVLKAIPNRVIRTVSVLSQQLLRTLYS